MDRKAAEISVDERIYSHVDDRISIGDYILSGGELAAGVVVDSILRLLPGVLRAASTMEESFSGSSASGGLLEYPQFTRPADLDGDHVPEVLLSGDHEAIRLWRLKESLRATLRWRPELLSGRELSAEEQQLLNEIREAFSRCARHKALSESAGANQTNVMTSSDERFGT